MTYAKKVLIPETLEDITLGQYLEYKAIPDDASEEFVQLRMLEIFAGINKEDALRIRFKDRAEMLNDFVHVLSQESNDLIRIHTFDDGKKYGFIPNLDTITNAEFMDADTLCRDEKEWPKLFSVLYRPVTFTGPGEIYSIEEYSGQVDEERMKKLPMSVVMGALVFFCDLGAACVLHTLRSLKEEAQRNTTSSSVKNGVGLQRSLNSRMAFFWTWKRFLKNAFLNPYISLPTEGTTSNAKKETVH